MMYGTDLVQDILIAIRRIAHSFFGIKRYCYGVYVLVSSTSGIKDLCAILCSEESYFSMICCVIKYIRYFFTLEPKSLILLFLFIEYISNCSHKRRDRKKHVLGSYSYHCTFLNKGFLKFKSTLSFLKHF